MATLTPIFPLSTVLFPGLPLPLHIFEDRYKQMMQRCISDETPFVVALIKKGQEALSCVAEPFSIGTAASIRQIDYLDDGKFNLVATGTARVKILHTSEELPYLSGSVEVLPFADEDLEGPAALLRSTAQEFLKLLGKSRNIAEFDLPVEARELVFFCASILPVSCQVRQGFLEQPRLSDLAADLQSRFSRQIALIQAVGNESTRDPYLN